MRVCLFKLGPRARLLALGFGTLGSLGLGGACGGEKFSADNGPSVSGASGVGAGGEPNSEAGESGGPEEVTGGAPSAGSGGDAMSAGSAGKPVLGCDCHAPIQPLDWVSATSSPT